MAEKILVVDDTPVNVKLLADLLAVKGYAVVTAASGVEALAVVEKEQPALVLLDVMMPKVDGVEVCRRLKSDATFPFTPIVLVTALADAKDVVAGLEAGGDEYLTKPVDHAALRARVRSMLRIKALHDTVQEQTGRLSAQSAQLAEWNRTLEARVKEQLD